MNLRSVAAVAAVLLGSVDATAYASTIVDVSGSIRGQAFTATLNLNVSGNTVTSGTGTFSGYGLVNNDLTLITAQTPYNEPSFYGPIGFRGNDGTDLLGLDQNYPIDGLLFDIGAPAAPNAFPLFTVYTNNDGSYGAGFTGMVNGNEYYFQLSNPGELVTVTTVSVGTVPLPPAAPMFGIALLGLAGVGYAAKRKKAATV